VPLRGEVRARFVAAVHRRAERSDAPDAIELWHRALAQDPYDERSHRSLVLSLRAERRFGEARTAYQSYVAAMDDLGVAPSSWDELAP
jgi:DNA-binding SARP family transcriptional activator